MDILLYFALNVDNFSFYSFFAVYLCSGIYGWKACPECLYCWHLSILKSSYNLSFCCLVGGLWHPDVGGLIIQHFKEGMIFQKSFMVLIVLPHSHITLNPTKALMCFVFFLLNILLCISSEGLLEDDFSLFSKAKNIVNSVQSRILVLNCCSNSRSYDFWADLLFVTRFFLSIILNYDN